MTNKRRLPRPMRPAQGPAAIDSYSPDIDVEDPDQDALIMHYTDMTLVGFLEEQSDPLQKVGSAWRQFDATKTLILQPSSVTALAQLELAANAQSVEANRAGTRQLANLEKLVRKRITETIVFTQNRTYMSCFGTPDELKAAQQWVIDTKAYLDSTDRTLACAQSPLEFALIELSLNIAIYYSNAIVEEIAVKSNFSFWLGADLTRIGTLADYIISDKCDEHEQRPFLHMLARDVFEDKKTSILIGYLELVSKMPVFSKKSAVEALFQDYADYKANGSEDPTLSFLGFLDDNGVLKDGLEGLKKTLLDCTEVAGLPSGIVDRILVSHGANIETLRQIITQRLAEFIKPHRLMVPTRSVHDTPDRGHDKRKRGTQSRRSVGKAALAKNVTAVEGAEQAPTAPISNIGLLKGTSGGNVYTISEQDKDSLGGDDVDGFMRLSPIADYMGKYHDDEDLKADIRWMVEQILAEPRSECCTKMKGGGVSIANGDSTNKTYPIWHINPRIRPREKSLTPVGKYTRIYYILIENKVTGAEDLFLLDVMHKNEAVGIKGNAASSRS